MDKLLLSKVKKQLLDEKTNKLGWTLPIWVAKELFDHIEKLEVQVATLEDHIKELENENV